MREKRRVFVSFIDQEKAYDRVNSKTVWQVLRMYYVGVNCWLELRVCILKFQFVSEQKGAESDRFRLDSGVGRLAEVCKRRVPKINAGKGKVMVWGVFWLNQV